MIVCKVCHEHKQVITKATLIAPQYEGGDENGHVAYVPICDGCTVEWYRGVSLERQIPMIALPEEHHEKHPDISLLMEGVES